MGFSVYYRSTRPVSHARADAIRETARRLNEGRTWLSCEPVHFFADQEGGRLLGGSKPNFQPHPDDVASAAREGLPDGTVRDMIEVLCRLSKDHGVDWELSHDYDPGPVGFIRGGVCDPRLLEQMEALADLSDMFLNEMTEEPKAPGGEDAGDDDDDGPSILPFRPRGG
jgi:hypothetical protein